MQPADYRRIESELQQQIRQSALPNALGESLSRKGWSTGCLGILSIFFKCGVWLLQFFLDSDDSDDEFHPFETVRPNKKADGRESSPWFVY